MEKQISVILGMQYGDEGKGKFTDLISSEYDYIVRYQGGDNAGHSITINNNKYALRLIPSGIFNKKHVVIGNGCVVNIETLLYEIEYLKQNGFEVDQYLHISDKAHVIFDYDILMDKLLEQNKGDKKIGTTAKGIGPTYVDKYARVGIRVCDLFDFEILKEKIDINLKEKNILFKTFNYQVFDYNVLSNKYYELAKHIKKYVCNSSKLLNDAIKNNKKILLEGAQGVLLDIDFGTYPFVTSSNVATGMSSGTGIGITKINHVFGIFKAYTSRVGEGPFCSEIHDEMLSEKIRKIGNEYGTVTKRPRRIGWLDIVALKYAIDVSGANELAITLIDVLSNLEKIKICIGYKLNNEIIDYIPSSNNEYNNCEPVYIEMDGWNQDITNINSYDMLPDNCKNYVNKVSELLKTKISYISVGPNRHQSIKVK